MIPAKFISEENKAKTKLGKRIKFLGIHQIQIEGKVPEVMAYFIRGMGWREISGETFDAIGQLRA